MLPEFAREELAAGLDRVAEEILDEARIRKPPIDALAVAQALGIAVAVPGCVTASAATAFAKCAASSTLRVPSTFASYMGL